MPKRQIRLAANGVSFLIGIETMHAPSISRYRLNNDQIHLDPSGMRFLIGMSQNKANRYAPPSSNFTIRRRGGNGPLLMSLLLKNRRALNNWEIFPKKDIAKTEILPKIKLSLTLFPASNFKREGRQRIKKKFGRTLQGLNGWREFSS